MIGASEMASAFGWLREAGLAIGLISLLVLGLWATTGSFPPMVVVESKSMMHAEDGEVGAIDPGDLILVMSTERRTKIVSYAEALEVGGEFSGWESHGGPGDVIIYKKNGGEDTPVIHRVLLGAVANGTVSPNDKDAGLCPQGSSWDPLSLDIDGTPGTCVVTWDAPGTTLRDVESITWTFEDFNCPSNPHGLIIQEWDPGHAGYLTLGDNNRCDVDQGSTAYPLAGGLTDEHGDRVQAVRSDWIVGVAGPEIPWLGTVKLAASNNAAQVTGHSWRMLALSAAILLGGTMAFERVTEKLIQSSPDISQAQKEEASSDEEE